MKKVLLHGMFIFIGCLSFAQTFNINKLALEGVISVSVNRDDSLYEIITVNQNDKTYFLYTWTRTDKFLFSKTTNQYRCYVTVTSIQENNVNRLIIKPEDKLYSRSIGYDGPGHWQENANAVYEGKLVNKEFFINLAIKDIETTLLEELNKPDEQLLRSLITFLSDEINLTYLDSDSLSRIVSNYKDLCSIPAIINRLKNEKSEIWFQKYKESIIDANFNNTFQLKTVKESDTEGFKYLAVFNCSVYDNYSIFESNQKKLESRKNRIELLRSQKNRLISINFYTNDDRFINMNSNDNIVISGKLKKVNISGEQNIVSSIEVYE